MTNEDAMYRATTLGDTETVRALVAGDPNILKAFAVNQSWLHWAAQKGNVEIMEALVKAGLPIDQLTSDGTDTPLEVAAGLWLLDHGANINHGLGKVATPIFSAIYSRSLELVKENGSPEILKFVKEHMARHES